MTRSVSKSDSVSHEYANNRCFRRSVCRLWSLFQVAVLFGVLKYFALIRNRDYFSVRVANVILDEPLLQGSLSRVAKNITNYSYSSIIVEPINKDIMHNETGHQPIQEVPFPYVKGANIVWWDDQRLDKDLTMASSCYLGSNWTFLGHGMTHFAFTAPVICEKRKEPTSSIPSPELEFTTPPRSVLLRLASKIVQREPEKQRRYVSIWDSVLLQGAVFARAIRGNWSSDKVDEFYCVQKGIVDIPYSFFNESDDEFRSFHMSQGYIVGAMVRDNDNSTTKRKRQSNAEKKQPKEESPFFFPPSSNSFLRAELSMYAPGRNLYNLLAHPSSDPELELIKDRHLKILQNLVTLYQHMYQQQVVHCDMHAGHLMVDITKDSVHSRMVDFERIRAFDPLDGKNHDSTLRHQLWQMMGILAKTCAPNIRKSDYPVYTGICREKEWKVDVYEEQLLPELKRCPFVVPMNEILVTNKGDYGDLTNETVLVRQLLTGNISQSYEIMSILVGLQEQQ